MPEQNENRKVVPFYALRLGDLMAPKARLMVKCGFCNRTGELDVLKLAWAKGRHTLLKELEASLRCQHCATRGWVSFSLDWIE